MTIVHLEFAGQNPPPEGSEADAEFDRVPTVEEWVWWDRRWWVVGRVLWRPGVTPGTSDHPRVLVREFGA